MKKCTDYINKAQESVLNVTIEDAVNKLNSQSTLFVDIRDKNEILETGKIPEAELASRGMLEFYIDTNSPFHKPFFSLKKHFIFYCGNGGRSVLAVERAQEMGLTNVFQLEGGFKAWQKSGGSIEQI